MIDRRSRYAKTQTRPAQDARGESVELLELREVPTTAGFFERTPTTGERLDHLAQRYYRDPRKFWRICDAAEHLDPFDVIVPGVPVLIPSDR